MRASAQERRDGVVRAAVAEFAKGGLHGTPTAAIALRVGVSQPYLFRLFPSKRALFTAATIRSFECSAAVYAHAARDLRGTAALEAMTRSRDALLGESGVLLMRLQAVTAAASGADPALASVVRGRWSGLWDLVQDRSGAPSSALSAFFADEALVTVRESLAARDAGCRAQQSSVASPSAPRR